MGGARRRASRHAIPRPRRHLGRALRRPGRRRALGAAPVLALHGLPAPPRIVGWGARASGRRAARLAARTGAQLLLLEDGFLRSARREDPPLSIVIDDLGLYHDARRPSRLERQIAADPADPARAQRLSSSGGTAACRRSRGSRPALCRCRRATSSSSTSSWATPPSPAASPIPAVSTGCSRRRAPSSRLPIVLKTHPDTALRGRRSHFAAARVPPVVAVTEACDPAPLIAGAEAVYTVTSQGGFEALLHGRPVRSFGMPFYAGWGLTDDDLPAPPRRGKASLEALVHAALVDYPRYLDPDTGRLTTVEATMDRLARPAAARAA
jgi:capsular polysaccharide export protein